MQDLQDQFGLTYLFISHDLAVVDLVCDEVIVLQHGRVVEQGAAAQVLRQPAHPYTQRLLQSLPGQGLAAHPAADAECAPPPPFTGAPT
jgi:peptide/nickel transport system ATP-binding protein